MIYIITRNMQNILVCNTQVRTFNTIKRHKLYNDADYAYSVELWENNQLQDKMGTDEFIRAVETGKLTV